MKFIYKKSNIKWLKWFTIASILFLSWFYFIDGHILNKPITFTNGVDQMNLKVDKEVYQIGDTPQLYSSFCVNRLIYTSVTSWTLIDHQIVNFSPKPFSGNPRIPTGCYGQEFPVKYTLEKIPITIEKTCNAYFTGVGTVTISGNRKIKIPYKTETFCIDTGELEEIIEEA